ncbi:hypothetical protein [Ruegeria sp. HKCCD9179]|uniref:hypothetical protein n=1 Tax=Ruegeria sp. HKCCD9179 TaxID=2683016 RepID=UPI0014890E7A|nr:hypothetical protein [Ruegeria sp. HKCCD9179]
MQSEKLDILAYKRKQNGQVLMMLANYCRKHRMIDFDLRRVPPSHLDRIGNEIVDLFVDRIRKSELRTPPGKGAHNDAGIPRSRERSRA